MPKNSKHLLFALHCVNKAINHVETLSSHLNDGCKTNAVLQDEILFTDIVNNVNTINGVLHALSLRYAKELHDSYDIKNKDHTDDGPQDNV